MRRLSVIQSESPRVAAAPGPSDAPQQQSLPSNNNEDVPAANLLAPGSDIRSSREDLRQHTTRDSRGTGPDFSSDVGEGGIDGQARFAAVDGDIGGHEYNIDTKVE
jgi:hypothetical protein